MFARACPRADEPDGVRPVASGRAVVFQLPSVGTALADCRCRGMAGRPGRVDPRRPVRSDLLPAS